MSNPSEQNSAPKNLFDPNGKHDGIPKGFKLTEKGIYAIEKKKDRAGFLWEKERWIGDPLIVEAVIRDERSQNWGRVILFNDPDGISHRLQLFNDSLSMNDTRSFYRDLANLGYTMASGKKSRYLLENYIKDSSPEARVRLKIRRNDSSGSVHWEPCIQPDQTNTKGKVENLETLK